MALETVEQMLPWCYNGWPLQNMWIDKLDSDWIDLEDMLDDGRQRFLPQMFPFPNELAHFLSEDVDVVELHLAAAGEVASVMECLMVGCWRLIANNLWPLMNMPNKDSQLVVVGLMGCCWG